MARVSVNELFDGRSASADFELKKEYKRKWEVITDDPADDEDVAGAPGGDPDEIPAIGDPHPDKPYAFLTDIGADQHPDSPYIWYVSGTYATAPRGEGGQEFANSSQPVADEGDTPETQSPASVPSTPTARAPAWKFGFDSAEEVLDRDKDGTLIVNSAGLPFDPPLKRDRRRLVFSITVFRAKFSVVSAMATIDGVNAAAWRGCPERTARVTGLDASAKYEQGTYCWEIAFQVTIKPDTWDRKILDAGFVERISEGGITRYVQIVDAAGKEPKEPFPLKNGRALRDGEEPTYLTFRVFNEINFTTALGF